jgi:CcmD family protein
VQQKNDVANDPGLGPALAEPKPESVPGSPAVAPADRSTQFVAVEGGAETTSAEALLVAAYIVMWALLLGFVLLSWRRQQRIEQRVGELEKALVAAEREPAKR